MGLIHLLQIRLQESSCYNAPKHDESDFGRAIAGTVSLGEGSVDSRRMVVDGDIVIAGGSSRRQRIEAKKVPNPSRSSGCCSFPTTTVPKFRGDKSSSSIKRAENTVGEFSASDWGHWDIEESLKSDLDPQIAKVN